jgi:hypothetical protein
VFVLDDESDVSEVLGSSQSRIKRPRLPVPIKGSFEAFSVASTLTGNLASLVFNVEMYIAVEYYNIPA